MAGLFESLLPGALTAGAGVTLASDIANKGEEVQQTLTDLGGQMQDDAAFTGYSVKTGLGASTIAPDGSLNVGVGQDAGLAGMGYDNMGAASGAFGSALTGAQAGGYNAQLPTALSGLAGAGQGLAGAQAGALGASQQAMANSMQDNGAREQEIYQRMMAAQQPGMDRATAGMESRAHAQGRGGISGSQYGGSGEQFANSRAQAEARNSAMLGAMGQSQNEMMNQGALASQYGQLGQGYSGLQGSLSNMYGQLGNQNAQLGQGAAGLMSSIGGAQGQLGLGQDAASYSALQNQLQAGQLGYQNADMAQTGQITGTNLMAQLGLGGAQTGVNALKSSSELYGNMFGSMAAPLAGLGAVLDPGEDGTGGLWNFIRGK